MNGQNTHSGISQKPASSIREWVKNLHYANFSFRNEVKNLGLIRELNQGFWLYSRIESKTCIFPNGLIFLYKPPMKFGCLFFCFKSHLEKKEKEMLFSSLLVFDNWKNEILISNSEFYSATWNNVEIQENTVLIRELVKNLEWLLCGIFWKWNV